MKLNNFLKKYAITGFIIFGLLVTHKLSGEENGRYTIINADGRIFLLDTKTGECFKYYFNKVSEQGWQQTFYHLGEHEGKIYYRESPGGKLESFSVSK